MLRTTALPSAAHRVSGEKSAACPCQRLRCSSISRPAPFAAAPASPRTSEQFRCVRLPSQPTHLRPRKGSQRSQITRAHLVPEKKRSTYGFGKRQYQSTVCQASRPSMSDSLEEVRPFRHDTSSQLHRSAYFAVVAQMGLRDRIATVFRFLADQPEAKTLIQAAQFASTLLFVVLYIWSTYSPPPLWSIRYNLDLFLCVMFAIDYFSRFLVRTSIFNPVPPCRTPCINLHAPSCKNNTHLCCISPFTARPMQILSVVWCHCAIHSVKRVYHPKDMCQLITFTDHRKLKTNCEWSPACGACWTSVHLLRHWLKPSSCMELACRSSWADLTSDGSRSSGRQHTWLVCIPLLQQLTILMCRVALATCTDNLLCMRDWL